MRLSTHFSVTAGATAVLALTGCAQMLGLPPPQQWTSEPPMVTVDKELYTVTVAPGCRDFGCKAFALTLMNKTDKNLEIDWNKTLFITRGQTSGGFMFEGVVYKDRQNPKPPDIVFPGSTLGKVLWPNNLVNFSGGRYGTGWEHQSMSPGETGVYLTVVVDGKEMNEKLTTTLTVAPK